MRQLGVAALLAGLLATPALAGKSDDTVRVAFVNPLETTDVIYQPNQETQGLFRAVYDTLLAYDEDKKIFVPHLAKAWRQIDAKTFEFDLREDVTFHDGSKFDADDVVYTLNFLADPQKTFPFGTRYNWMERAEKLGQYKVRLHLRRPDATWAVQLTFAVPMLPSDYHATIAEPRDFGRKPVATGPYKVESFEPGKQIVMVRNDSYVATALRPKPTIKRFIVRQMPDIQTQVAELVTGGIDFAYNIPGDLAENLKRSGRATIVQADSLYTIYFILDAQGRSGFSGLKDVRVRQAIAHAVNKQSLVKNLQPGGLAKVLNTFCHPSTIGCPADVAGIPYDPAKARALLAEAGVRDLAFSIAVFRQDQRNYAQAVIGDLKAVGINATLDFQAFPSFRQKQEGGNLPSYLVTISGGGQPDVSLVQQIHFGGGPADYARDSELAALIKAAQVEYDPARRSAIYAEGFKRQNEQAYVVPIATVATNFGINKDLLGKFDTYDSLPHFNTFRWK